MSQEPLVIAVDFDGTCVTHEFPEIGKPIGAQARLKELLAAGHKLVLFTMRSDQQKRAYLSEAVKWFMDRDIPLYGIQENPTQKSWTTSPKAYAQLYIDDAALGIPLIHQPDYSDRPFVDWKAVKSLLVERGIL
jgi:hypothetical protein